MIEPLLKNLPNNFEVEIIGRSELKKPIYAVKVGNGKKRILLWSQMHGNESTTTKAIFDLLNTFKDKNEVSLNILNTCNLLFIPILNPDGAEAYTRVNANEVDLNRDAKDLSQSESKVLRKQFGEFKPHYCFNLHGQRTIFGAGKATGKVATLSFLAPAADKTQSVTNARKKAMEIITVVNDELQNEIPNQIGRYDDTYNENCVGDTFQSLGVPTLLYEAGHINNDYAREHTRELIYQSLLVAFNYVALNSIIGAKYESYFNIPQNEKCFFDIIIRNAKLKDNGRVTDLAFQYQEELVDGKVIFRPILEKIDLLKDFYGHIELNANGNDVSTPFLDDIKEGYSNDFVIINSEEYSLLLHET